MTTAFLFPGQGAQGVGMGRDLAAGFPESRAVFEEADDALGFALSRLCFEGPEDQLQLTANTQPAILTTSVAALRALEACGASTPDVVAGHSLGEYSALVAAGVIAFADAVRTVRQRGQFMQEAVPVGAGAMTAVLGLAADAVAEACSAAAGGQVVGPANLNSAAQVVIAGHREAVERAEEECRARGAKRVVRLPVSAPFHCPLMQPAQDRLEPVLASLSLAEARVPVVRNVDAAPVTAADDCRSGLLRQVSAPVQWERSMRRLVADGVTTMVEVGPGSTLQGLMRQIERTVARYGAGTADAVRATTAALVGGGS